LIFVAAFAYLLPVTRLAAQHREDNPVAICRREQLKDAATVKGFIFRTYENDGDDPACLTVSRDGKVIFREAEHARHYTLGQPMDSKWKTPAIPNGTDVTGRGHPNMIVSYWTGGAHCCSSHYVFELEPDFKLLTTLDDQDDDLAHFEKIGSQYFYKTFDWSFAYWPSCYACSPSHPVVLRFVNDAKDGAYHLAIDKMWWPAPDERQWKAALADVNDVVKEDGVQLDEIGTTLWNTVLDLIYTGHSDLAWKFIEEAGPQAQKEPLPDLETFCSKLKQSPYWPDLQPTLRNSPPECVNDRPGRALP